VPHGELLNVMLGGSAATRLMQAPERQVLAEVLPELQRYFPGIDRRIGFAHFSRWALAEPRSPVGRSRDLQQYRQRWHPGMKVILAGDYMSIPCTEGAAESGDWAATALVERTARVGRNKEAGSHPCP
jgi:oxygen-dependent protoporphyrinogen oxidase